MARFDDGKDAGALRTIGEVSTALGIRPHVLRYWEGQFPALRPLKRAGGRRLYRPEDVALIAEIDRLLTREGYTLRGAKAALSGGLAPRSEPANRPRPRPERDSEASAFAPPAQADIAARLRAIRADLAQALAA